jgi:arylformamidase
MRARLVAFGEELACDFSQGTSAAWPVRFDDEGVARAFHLPPPSSRPVRAGPFLGSVREGGSVNCHELTLTPHGDGTHTECVGHIVEERVAVAELAPTGLLPALLVSARATPLAGSGEGYGGEHKGLDLVVTGASLARAAGAIPLEGCALVVRASPGEGDLSGQNPPYFTAEALAWMLARGVAHLLTDLPSIDREDDGGHLANHRRFWGLAPGATALEGAASPKTVTELCRLPAALVDGRYLLSLQVPPLHTDAAPSRPVLYPLEAL